jgi:Inner membrane protein CreD
MRGAGDLDSSDSKDAFGTRRTHRNRSKTLPKRFGPCNLAAMSDQQTPPPPLPKSQPSFGKRHSTIIKLIGVGALVLILLIPLAMITGVLSDRLMRRNEAVNDITSS